MSARGRPPIGALTCACGCGAAEAAPRASGVPPSKVVLWRDESEARRFARHVSSCGSQGPLGGEATRARRFVDLPLDGHLSIERGTTRSTSRALDRRPRARMQISGSVHLRPAGVAIWRATIPHKLNGCLSAAIATVARALKTMRFCRVCSTWAAGRLIRTLRSDPATWVLNNPPAPGRRRRSGGGRRRIGFIGNQQRRQSARSTRSPRAEICIRSLEA